jgi:hypothetical protein
MHQPGHRGKIPARPIFVNVYRESVALARRRASSPARRKNSSTSGRDFERDNLSGGWAHRMISDGF